jgi:hypothetical protein
MQRIKIEAGSEIWRHLLDAFQNQRPIVLPREERIPIGVFDFSKPNEIVINEGRLTFELDEKRNVVKIFEKELGFLLHVYLYVSKSVKTQIDELVQKLLKEKPKKEPSAQSDEFYLKCLQAIDQKVPFNEPDLSEAGIRELNGRLYQDFGVRYNIPSVNKRTSPFEEFASKMPEDFPEDFPQKVKEFLNTTEEFSEKVNDCKTQ